MVHEEISFSMFQQLDIENITELSIDHLITPDVIFNDIVSISLKQFNLNMLTTWRTI